MEKQRELTFGEKAVGLTFNPSGREDVNKVKQLSADLLDLVDADYKFRTSDGKQASWMTNVLRTSAVTTMLIAQSAIVKLLTWND